MTYNIISGSFKISHFDYSSMYYVTKCQFLKGFILEWHERTKINHVISSSLLKVIYFFVCLSAAAYELWACWLYRMFMICIN